jgi:hypothetical protein
LAVEQGTDMVRAGPWLELYQELSARDPAGLDATELEALAEAAWWLCRTGESIAARHRAHAAFRRAGDDRGAARTAARLFHDHFYRDETAVAVGWLRRGFRHVERDPGCREHGWLECARAELHLHQGPLDRAAGHADPTRLAALVEAAGFADVTTGTVTATYRFASPTRPPAGFGTSPHRSPPWSPAYP